MRLSFVVPAYNEEAYLPACLESILTQIDPATSGLAPGTCEIIVVNNASTDRTREVALRYPGVTVVDEPRKGLTFARQAGFAASTGDLIANVDSDVPEVIDVLALAGGLTDIADRHITIERYGNPNKKIDYYYSNVAGTALQDDPMVYPGDTVIVPKAAVVYVLAMSRSLVGIQLTPTIRR